MVPARVHPLERGRNFDGIMGGDAWTPEDSPMNEVARNALLVNLLTEDNLPSYHHEIATIFGRDDVGVPGCIAGPPRRAATGSRCATTSWSSAPSTRWSWSASG